MKIGTILMPYSLKQINIGLKASRRCSLITNNFKSSRNILYTRDLSKHFQLALAKFIPLLYKIQDLMKAPLNKAELIKRPFPYVEEELLQQIRCQLQFYFSMANLVTDSHLKSVIRSAYRGWIKVADLLRFSRLHQLMLRAFQKEASLNEKEYLVKLALKDSVKLKSSKGRVKLKRRLFWQEGIKNVLYFEAENHTHQRVQQLFDGLHLPPNTYMTKTSQTDRWVFVEFEKFVQISREDLHNKIRQKCSQHEIKVLTMEQFYEFEKTYKRLFQLDQEPSPQQKQAKKPKTPKKSNTDNKSKSLKAAREVLSGYLKTRNPRNPEAYQQHRLAMIAAQRQRKAQRDMSCGMAKMRVSQQRH